MQWKLFVTRGCHLCALAEQVLAEAGLAAGAVETVEIGYDPELARCYGVRIPVLRLEPVGLELDWPFGAEDVQRLRG